MTRPLKAGLIAGILAIIAAGTIEAALAKAKNDFFQFCTTKAYGWPAPWKIDYCECEGAKTAYLTTSSSTIAGSGIAGFALFGWVSILRQCVGFH